jgi:DNA gyrase subunit A
MAEVAQELLSVNLEDEMRQSYLDYAMSVIVGRALPDVRDGLKPVHRRVLYAMRELGNDYNKPYKKSARVVGDVIGKYHPHGDTAVYDTIVRMAQSFSMRYLLVDGQGNFGSVDGDAPAAMRYTEVRMSRLAHELLADIEKETVDFVENYDGSESEPSVMPTRVPNLLVNGSSGIAVGMATNIPPHNLSEVIDACLALIDDPSIEVPGLMDHLPGPDFPTAGIISGAQGILSAYRTGRGRVYVRARTAVEEFKPGREAIIVTELPYQVNKARLIEKIADLVREKRLEGISELRDESDKDGMRVVIELKRGESSEVVLNNLYKHTPMQSVFGINMVALRDGRPQLMNLKQVLEAFLAHRREVVTRRTIFDLRKARDRAHVLEGQTVALANIDEVIELIKGSPSPADARDALVARPWQPGAVTGMLERAGRTDTRPDGLAAEFGLHDGRYHLSPVQAQAILDLRLHRLTGLEQGKILNEYKEILDKIKQFSEILADPDKLLQVIRDELGDIRSRYGDARRTEIVKDHTDLQDEDLIPEEDVVVTLSHGGYAKAQPIGTYQAQRRGGRGRSATRVKDEDFIEKLFVANTHDTRWRAAVPAASPSSTSCRWRPANASTRFCLYGSSIPTASFSWRPPEAPSRRRRSANSRGSGIIAIDLRNGDKLVDAKITNGDAELLLVTSSGKGIRFRESDVRPMGRGAAGVRGIKLAKGHEVIALSTVQEGLVLTATENGYGKRTEVEDFPVQGRGGQGVIAIQTTERNGRTVGAVLVGEGDEIMLISSNGTLVRTPVDDISVQGRNTQGVRLIRVEEGQRLVGVARIEPIDDEDEE